MDETVRRLARSLSEGDDEVASQLAVELARRGYLQFEGKESFYIRDVISGMCWGGPNRRWGTFPKHYKTLGLANAAAKAVIFSEWNSAFEIVKVKQVVLETYKEGDYELAKKSKTRKT